MNKYIAAVAAALIAQSAHGAGLDRSGQSVGALFADGNQIEFSLGLVMPDVSGTDAASNPTGDVGNDYSIIGLAYKRDINPTWSTAIIFDQPFGGDVTYGASSPVYGGTSGMVTSNSITALGQYNMGNGFSIHGGVRTLSTNADVTLSGAAYGATSGYTFDGSSNTALGYVVGAAYEKPEIALRVALTYSSEIDLDLDTTEVVPGAGTFTPTIQITAPKSVNLDFQTGIMADTLVFGSVRWVAWDGFNVTPATLGSALVSYTDDRLTYNLGVGRRFNDQWSGAIQIGYEDSVGGTSGALGPTDGFLSIGAGATYTMANGSKITGGLRYIMPGDANVASGGSTASFSDNSGIAAGLKFEMKL